VIVSKLKTAADGKLKTNNAYFFIPKCQGKATVRDAWLEKHIEEAYQRGLDDARKVKSSNGFLPFVQNVASGMWKLGGDIYDAFAP